MPKIPHKDEIVELMEEAIDSISDTPPSLIEFRKLVDLVRSFSCENNDQELIFMSFIFDGVLDQVMRHVAGHASTLVNKDDTIAILQRIGTDLKLVSKSLKETDLNSLHMSYVNLVANSIKLFRIIRVEVK